MVGGWKWHESQTEITLKCVCTCRVIVRLTESILCCSLFLGQDWKVALFCLPIANKVLFLNLNTYFNDRMGECEIQLIIVCKRNNLGRFTTLSA